jgi:hypothetical protein
MRQYRGRGVTGRPAGPAHAPRSPHPARTCNHALGSSRFRSHTRRGRHSAGHTLVAWAEGSAGSASKRRRTGVSRAASQAVRKRARLTVGFFSACGDASDLSEPGSSDSRAAAAPPVAGSWWGSTVSGSAVAAWQSTSSVESAKLGCSWRRNARKTGSGSSSSPRGRARRRAAKAATRPST